jgi:poly(3-hydroxybutyrate) depolymerase
VLACLANGATAQAPVGWSQDVTIRPGANYDRAAFRLWMPARTEAIRAVAVLVPGSNGDGRPEVTDPAWEAFATRNHVALVACQFTDRAHDQAFIEQYVKASGGSGQALLDALSDLAARAGRPELADAPLLLWGMSAGGQFNYEFTAWKPERVMAFVVNKGGIYYTALTPPASRAVPGLLFTGEKDLWSRNDTVAGIFAVNRRAGALWAIAEEPGVAHVVGRSRDVTLVFFEEVLRLRFDAQHPNVPRPLAEKDGFIGDVRARTTSPASENAGASGPTAWLPTERVAQAWLSMVTGQPIGR